MSPKDEFIDFQNKHDAKVTFVTNEQGHVIHIVKRAELRLYDLFSYLQKLRCLSLPVIFDVVRRDDSIEVHEEYIRGRTLEAVLRESGTLGDAALLAAATDICRALVAIHGCEPPIVHRDIKPANIMERESGGYVLIDFDAARMHREDADTDTRCIATVGYAAPEQYGLSQTDARSDLFSLGVTLYELKTGESYRVGAVCGGQLGRIIAKCTAFEPKRRFQSAEQLLARLMRLQPANRRRANRWRLCVASLSLITAASIAAAVVFGIRSERASQVPVAAAPAATSAPVSTPAALSTPNADEKEDEPIKHGEEPPAPAIITFDGSGGASDTGCICTLYDVGVTTADGTVLKFDGSTPVTEQLLLTGKLNSSDCSASEHAVNAGLTACQIEQMTIGASAEVTDDTVTFYAPGAYQVDGFIQQGGDVDSIASGWIIVAEHPEAYSECSCVLNTEKMTPKFYTDQQLPADGSPLELDLSRVPYYEDRLCTSDVHKEYLELSAYIEQAPEGARCGVADGYKFYTYTPGVYDLRQPGFYDGGIYNAGCRITVSASAD